MDKPLQAGSMLNLLLRLWRTLRHIYIEVVKVDLNSSNRPGTDHQANRDGFEGLTP
jgi:hypothetical protein